MSKEKKSHVHWRSLDRPPRGVEHVDMMGVDLGAAMPATPEAQHQAMLEACRGRGMNADQIARIKAERARVLKSRMQ
jgi:hypothetical protein